MIATNVRIVPSWLYQVGSPTGRRNDLMIGDIHRPQRNTASMLSVRPIMPSRVKSALIGPASLRKYADKNVRFSANSQAGIDHSMTPAKLSAKKRLTPPVTVPRLMKPHLLSSG